MIVAADEELHSLLTLTSGSCLAAGSPTGGLEFTYGHPLEVTRFREQHNGTFVGDQVNVFESTPKVENLSAPGGWITVTQLDQLVLNQAEHPLTPSEDVLVIGDLGD